MLHYLLKIYVADANYFMQSDKQFYNGNFKMLCNYSVIVLMSMMELEDMLEK